MTRRTVLHQIICIDTHINSSGFLKDFSFSFRYRPSSNRQVFRPAVPYPAQIVDNKGGYKVQYLDDDGELIPDEIEENVVVTRIRKPKKKKRVSVGQKEAEEEAPDSDE